MSSSHRHPSARARQHHIAPPRRYANDILRGQRAYGDIPRSQSPAHARPQHLPYTAPRNTAGRRYQESRRPYPRGASYYEYSRKNSKRPARKPHILVGTVLALILVAGLVNLLSLPDKSEAEPPARQTRTETTEQTESEQKAAKQVHKLKATQKAQRRKTDEAQKRLDAAVSALEEDGVTVSYIICDLNSANTLEYNADAINYSASTIKAPFVISVMESEGGDHMRAVYRSQVEATLVNSNNETYSTLRKAYYSQPYWSDFCARAEVDPDNAHWYKHLSVREMARLWITAQPWLSSGSENAQWICGLLSDSYKSLVDDLAGPTAQSTWSKAGWYAGDPEYNVTFNAGIVNADFGSYVISVAISKGSDFEALQSVMEPLFDTWNASHQLPAAAA